MIRTSSILFWFSLAITASFAFYHTTGNVQALEQKLRNTNASIENEQQSIHVLNAEWVYLSNPERVEVETRKFLTALRPTAPHQVGQLTEMADMLPARDEAPTNVAMNATPLGNIHSTLAAPTPQPRHIAANKVKGTIAVASADTGHINDRMIMQHSASIPGPDAIGSLITELGTHP